MEDKAKVIRWRPIAPISESKVDSNGSLAALDALRAEWASRLEQSPESERAAIRQRSLRRLAIETGIIERIYEIDWGLTLTLIAEGFTKDVVERHGGAIDDRTRATLEAQRDSLQMVLDFVASSRELTVGFICELHSAMTRSQLTYTALDSLGRPVEVSLPHGTWKTSPNHVRRADGTLLEYAPPEHVQSEMERLVAEHSRNEAARHHPILLAAWLHHRFVQIHPFADGNGRVARALVLLVLQKHKFAPLVVDRFHRDKYLVALDHANDGDLSPLVKLFVNLEGTALISELEAPQDSPAGSAVEVAHVLASQIKAARRAHETSLAKAIEPRALMLKKFLATWFESKRTELATVLQGINVSVTAEQHDSDDPDFGVWFKSQIIDAAHRAGYYADFSKHSCWTQVRVRTGGDSVRFVAALHGAGRGSGVVAVATFGEVESVWDDEGERRRDRVPVETTVDVFRVVHTESVELINSRYTELSALLDEGLAVALAALLPRVGRSSS